MTDFLITAPDGKKYKVSGPDQAGAVAALKKYIAASNQPAPSAPASTNGAAGATFDRIMKALRNAHQAGDTNAATRLAAMAKTARAKEAATGSENLKNLKLPTDLSLQKMAPSKVKPRKPQSRNASGSSCAINDARAGDGWGHEEGRRLARTPRSYYSSARSDLVGWGHFAIDVVRNARLGFGGVRRQSIER